MKISTSFLSCKKIFKAIKKIDYTDSDYVHVDFVDGKFASGRKISFKKLKKISKCTTKRLDIHLMTYKLKKYIKKAAVLNAEYITFHVEATNDVIKYIDLIHMYGIKCGLAINPDTDIDVIKPYLNMIDLVLVMGVVPGLGGQEFIKDTSKKVKKLKKEITNNSFDVVISVDGGINDDTLSLVEDSVDMICVGSYITNSSNYQKQIDSLR